LDYPVFKRKDFLNSMWRFFRITIIAACSLALVFLAARLTSAPVRAASEGNVPKFQVDANWPTMPNGWVFGQVSSTAIDDKNNVWVLHRPSSVRPGQKTGPPVMVFDEAGNYLRGWGGPGEGYDWPEREHGIYIDYRGFVWIGGYGNEDQILKFTQDGKFVMQIGHGGHKKTNQDTENFWRPAGMVVFPKTNELFVADGYGNKRIIVFDADTGKFKRMWGAFGKPPVDPVAKAASDGESAPSGAKKNADASRIPAKDLASDDPGPDQFNVVHDVKVSNDGFVYVSDRAGKRVQIFTIEGKYVDQIWIDRWCELFGQGCGNGQTAASTAFSADPEQRFLYVASRSPARILVFDRKSLKLLDSFGRPGVGPGEFDVLHHMTSDGKGNIYTSEVEDGHRVQKFVFKGLGAAK
jgi:hypothetical protein